MFAFTQFSHSVIKLVRARRCETRDSFEILSALCLKRKSAQDVCPFGKFSIVMEERFAARNCYWENEHSDALSSNTKARSLPNSMIAKVGVNRISQCARRCSAITKIDRDRRRFESRRSFIVSPVVNAQMLPILTRAKNYLFPFRFPTLTKYKSFFSSKLNTSKSILKVILPIFTCNGNARSEL